MRRITFINLVVFLVGSFVLSQACSPFSSSNGTTASSSEVAQGTDTTPPGSGGTPPPDNTPPTTDISGLLKGTVMDLVGPGLTVQQVESWGTLFTQYESQFKTFSEMHWKDSGASWDLGNYYDRAKIYYVWWARTGNAVYKQRADAMAVDYRDRFLVPNDYGTSAHWSQMAGVMLHAVLNSDAKSLTAVGRVADIFALPYYVNNLQDVNAEMDNRMQARTLTAFLYAYKTNAPSLNGNNWATLLRASLTKILASQAADGSYPFVAVQCGKNKNFMTGLLNDALIEYYMVFEKDPRILPAVKKSLDFMWTSSWRANDKAFTYLSGPCASDPEAQVSATDLNLMILPGFGWVYRMTGDMTYKTRGDAVFAGGVTGAWLYGSKPFNQNYTNSYKYFAFRGP